MRNITGICFPEGFPPQKTVKFSKNNGTNNHDFCTIEELKSQYKLVFYSTKTFAGDLNYLTILICARPIFMSETDIFVEAKITPFAIVLVTSIP